MDKEFAQSLIQQVLPSYEITETLGEGSFGSVFRMKDSLKERAVKIILLSAAATIEKGSITSANKKIERDFRHIVESYEKIQCEEIVTVYDFYKVFASEEKQKATAYAIVVMELYPLNLSDYVMDYFEKNKHLLDIEIAKTLMEKLAHLLGNLYTKRGFLFEDLKPDNLLLKEQGGDFKLVVGDIGGLKNIGSILTMGSQVTLSYCAPEVIRKGQKPDIKSIIYSYGIISYFIIEGHLPYEDHSVSDRIDLLKERGLAFDREDIPDSIRSIIEKCLAKEPHERFQDFVEIVEAIQGKAIIEDDEFSKKTIDLSNLVKESPQTPTPPQSPVHPRESKYSFRRTVMPFDALAGMTTTGTQRIFTDTRKRLDTIRITDEKSEIDKVDKEIRDLVIRSGDVYKIQNESYKVYNDIKIESDAILIIENAKLYFDEYAGIVSLGTFRAKNSVFCAIDFTKKWHNISLQPLDTRVNYIEGCKFRFGKGRIWHSLKGVFRHYGHSLNENYSYGGGLFIGGVRERIVNVNDCTFYNCSAHEGGGIFCLHASPSFNNCTFDNCSAALLGGGIGLVKSNPKMRNCRLHICFAHKGGGGMYCATSNPSLHNCVFSNCSTKYFYGGGIYCIESAPVIERCNFSNCSANRDGGGIYCDEKSKPRILFPVFSNCKPNNTNYDLRDATLKKFFK